MAVITLNADTSLTLGTAIANSGTAHTKSSYTQFSASLSSDIKAMLVTSVMGTAAGEALYDLATGAVASETDIIANQSFRRQTDFLGSLHYHPIQIASGTRLSGRFQATGTTSAWRPILYLVTDVPVPFDRCTSAVTYGAVTASTRGTAVQPGNTAHTKGNFIEITASTSADIHWLGISMQYRNVSSIAADTRWLIDIATGASSSETVVIADLHVIGGVSSDQIFPDSYLFPISIPSGTRLTARAQVAFTNASVGTIDMTLTGYTGSPAPSGGGGQRFSSAIV